MNFPEAVLPEECTVKLTDTDLQFFSIITRLYRPGKQPDKHSWKSRIVKRMYATNGTGIFTRRQSFTELTGNTAKTFSETMFKYTYFILWPH